jgi:hypothetical protein
MVQFLERVLVVSDNEDIHALALGLLKQRASERDRLRAEERRERFRAEWGRDLRFASKDLLLVVGPRIDGPRCAGSILKDSTCATTWRAWAAQ